MVTLPGMITEVKLPHDENALSPILVTPSDSVTVFRTLHDVKALLPIVGNRGQAATTTECTVTNIGYVAGYSNRG